MRRFRLMLASVLVGILMAFPAAAQQGKGSQKKPDEPKRPVDIVREPKSDPNKGRSGGKNTNTDRGGKDNKDRGGGRRPPS